MSLIYQLDGGGALHQLGIAEVSASPCAQGFGCVVIAAVGLESVRFVGPLHVVTVAMEDLFAGSPEWLDDTWRRVNVAADIAVERLRAGENVASVCWMGLNRSALVSGAILKKFGWTGRQAVERIRSWRGPQQGLAPLHNEAFVKMLEERS